MRLLFVGPPGSGKGTQATRLKKEGRAEHLSTGDMLRAAIAAGTELGKKAKAFMDRGELVPDDVVVGLIRERLKETKTAASFVLDGFPRNLTQAQTLDEMMEQSGLVLERAILFEMDDELLVQRLAGRRICESCGAMYHIMTKPVPADGKCETCGKQKIVQRNDDQESVIRNRLAIYHEQTEPLIEYYKGQGKLESLDASEPVEKVSVRVDQLLEAKGE